MGFIFVWLAKADIQAAFQQMEHWVSHDLSASCRLIITQQFAMLDIDRMDAAETGNVKAIVGHVLQACWCVN